MFFVLVLMMAVGISSIDARWVASPNVTVKHFKQDRRECRVEARAVRGAMPAYNAMTVCMEQKGYMRAEERD